MFEQGAIDAQPCGTIVRIGHGWLEGAAGDGPCVVRLQAHAERLGQEDADAWTDLVEIPYRSLTGAVQLSIVTGGEDEEQLKLGRPGMYRVRAAHRPLPQTTVADSWEDLEPTDLWQLDFWPVAEAEPPRWIRRARPPVRSTDPGRRYLLEYEAVEVADRVWYAKQDDGASVEELRQWAIDHHRGEDWLDQPLRPTTRPDRPSLAEIATQVGLPEPTSRRMLLPLFVALGALTFDGVSYVRAQEPPRAQDVIDLPADLVAALEGSQLTKRFTSYASDLVSVALWGGARQTAASLAERTLASEDDVHEALGYAVRRGLLWIDGQLTDEFVMAPVKR